jgi:preprotein translocase subunit SecF
MRRLFSHADYDYISVRRRAYIGSSIALLISVVFALFWHAKTGSWLKYGVDFTGGTLMQVEVFKPTSEGELRSMVSDLFEGGTEVVRSGDRYLIRTPTGEGDATSSANKVRDALSAKFGGPDSFKVHSAENVSSKVGGELQGKALLAILVSFGATLIYLAFRFEWRFGLAAVLATVHDILLTLGVIIIFRLDVSLDAVAAILTVVGYSLNDTVIIFDRIREHIKGKRGVDLRAMINRSINETLPRTVLTVSTTLATLFALFLLGGDVIRVFATILIVGIMLGTYSSIFIASAMLLEIEKRWPRPVATTVRKTRTTTGAARACALPPARGEAHTIDRRGRHRIAVAAPLHREARCSIPTVI